VIQYSGQRDQNEACVYRMPAFAGHDGEWVAIAAERH
jgi:hypothetical protein